MTYESGSNELEYRVWTVDEPIEQVGQFCFRLIEGHGTDYHLITNMHLEGPNESKRFKRQGIGQRILEIAKENGLNVVARCHDGIVRDDGSHLTNNAPAFTDKMENLGLLGRY